MTKWLEVYEFNNKIRKGVNCDGGYVICDLLDENAYDCYITAGVSNEESFTRDFLEMYKINKNNSFAFDGTIEDFPYHYTENITFLKKNISNINDDSHTNLDFLFEKYDNIFLKMDIEGGEYEWLLSIDENKLKKIKQLAIEFHGINDDTWNCSLSNKIKCLEKIFNTHYLVHAHGNNYGGMTYNIPDVIELTYLNKNVFTDTPNHNKCPLPIPNIDFPNNLHYPEHSLNTYPFTFP